MIPRGPTRGMLLVEQVIPSILADRSSSRRAPVRAKGTIPSSPTFGTPARDRCVSSLHADAILEIDFDVRL